MSTNSHTSCCYECRNDVPGFMLCVNKSCKCHKKDRVEGWKNSFQLSLEDLLSDKEKAEDITKQVEFLVTQAREEGYKKGRAKGDATGDFRGYMEGLENGKKVMLQMVKEIFETKNGDRSFLVWTKDYILSALSLLEEKITNNER